jgi:hypothetical protein
MVFVQEQPYPSGDGLSLERDEYFSLGLHH